MIVVCFRYWCASHYASDFWEPNQAEEHVYQSVHVSTWCPTPGLPSCSSQLSLASLHSYSCWFYYGFSAFLYWLLHDYCAKKQKQSWFVKNPEIRTVCSEHVPKIPIYLFWYHGIMVFFDISGYVWWWNPLALRCLRPPNWSANQWLLASHCSSSAARTNGILGWVTVSEYQTISSHIKSE